MSYSLARSPLRLPGSADILSYLARNLIQLNPILTAAAAGAIHLFPLRAPPCVGRGRRTRNAWGPHGGHCDCYTRFTRSLKQTKTITSNSDIYKYIHIYYMIWYDIILRPDALCCPEIDRDVPGMLMMMMMMMMRMSLTGVGELNPCWRIFNGCRSLTGVGELNPYWRIFNECRSLTGVGELNPYWRIFMNLEV